MIQATEIASVINDVKEKVSLDTGIINPSNMEEYNKINDLIFDQLENNLPNNMKFKDVIEGYHIALENDQLSAEVFRILMERKFGSKIY